MTHRFTAHEARPTPGTRPKGPAPAAAESGKTDKTGKTDKAEIAGKSGAVGKAKETGGPSGPEPTRYGDWERKGICVDF